MIALPPVLAGAVNDTVACALPATAAIAVGAPGTVAGITLLDAAEGAPLPTAFVATTVNVYAVPFVRPVTVNGLPAPDDVSPPGFDATVYPVMGLPPLMLGGVNETLACALLAVAVPIVGAFGTVAGVTVFDGADGVLLPTTFVATAVHDTDDPLVSPLTTMGDPVPPLLWPPQVTVYPVIALPPLLAGAAKDTEIWALPAVAVTPVGGSGTVAGVTLLEGADGGPFPNTFVAATVKV